MLDLRKRQGLAVAVALLAIAAIPLSRLWTKSHYNHPFVRLAEEREAERRAVADLARRDLDCPEVDVFIGDAVEAHGCGKVGRYTYAAGAFHLAGPPTEETSPGASPCEPLWTTGDERLPREAALAAQRLGHAARVRFPLSALHVEGLAKLRFGMTVDVVLEPDGGAPESIEVPCASEDAAGPCTLPWSAASEVDDCGVAR